MVRVVVGPVGMDRSTSAVSLSWVELGPIFQERPVSTALGTCANLEYSGAWVAVRLSVVGLGPAHPIPRGRHSGR